MNLLSATFSETMVSISILGFEKVASQVRKVGTCHKICEKNVTVWASRKARAPKTPPEIPVMVRFLPACGLWFGFVAILCIFRSVLEFRDNFVWLR